MNDISAYRTMDSIYEILYFLECKDILKYFKFSDQLTFTTLFEPPFYDGSPFWRSMFKNAKRIRRNLNKIIFEVVLDNSEFNV